MHGAPEAHLAAKAVSQSCPPGSQGGRPKLPTWQPKRSVKAAHLAVKAIRHAAVAGDRVPKVFNLEPALEARGKEAAKGSQEGGKQGQRHLQGSQGRARRWPLTAGLCACEPRQGGGAPPCRLSACLVEWPWSGAAARQPAPGIPLQASGPCRAARQGVSPRAATRAARAAQARAAHRVQLHGQASEGEAGDGVARRGRQQRAQREDRLGQRRVGVVLRGMRGEGAGEGVGGWCRAAGLKMGRGFGGSGERAGEVAERAWHHTHPAPVAASQRKPPCQPAGIHALATLWLSRHAVPRGRGRGGAAPARRQTMRAGGGQRARCARGKGSAGQADDQEGRLRPAGLHSHQQVSQAEGVGAEGVGHLGARHGLPDGQVLRRRDGEREKTGVVQVLDENG